MRRVGGGPEGASSVVTVGASLATTSEPKDTAPSLLIPLAPAIVPSSSTEGSVVQSATGLRSTDASTTRTVNEETQALLEARTALAKDLNRLPVGRTLARFTRAVDGILERLGLQIELELGPPPLDPSTQRPVAYQLFAAGSYARAALSPYSDVDYGLLMSKDTPEIREYFHRYTTRLGELLAAIDPTGALHACDLISPTGGAKDALLDTPGAMGRRAAGLSSAESFTSPKTAEYVLSALGSTRPIFARHGGAKLHEELITTREHELGPPAPNMDPKSLRAALVQLLLRSLREPFGVPKDVPGAGAGFTGQTPEAALAAGRVNVKHDLFKALYFPIVSLAALYGIREVGIPETLRALESRGHIPAVLATRLEEIYEALVSWRAKNHVAHGKSKEVLVPLEEHHIRAIRRMVPVLFRLGQELSRLSSTDPNRFRLGAST